MQENVSILVADDDADDRFLLKTMFQENGFRETLHFVEDGIELMEYLLDAVRDNQTNPLPKLILLDLNMPKKNGRQVLNELKENPVLKRIPVVIFSTTKNENEIKKCYELGAVGYVTKPDSYEAFIKTITDIMDTWLHTNLPDKIINN